MSPILVRPVREQLEHDRIIRLLPTRYKRRFEVGINPGGEQNAAVGNGPAAVYPDAVLYSPEKSRKVQGVVEVETIESINHLEAMAEWALYGRLKVPFHLYVPVASLDVARQLSTDHQVAVAEIWSFDNVGDQVRFTLVYKDPDAEVLLPPVAKAPVTKAPVAKAPAAKTPAAKGPVVKPTEPKPVAEKPAAKPAAKAKPAPKPVKAAKSAKPAKPAKPAPRPRTAAPARKPAAPARKPARPAAKAAAKRAPATARGRVAARKGSGASKRK